MTQYVKDLMKEKAYELKATLTALTADQREIFDSVSLGLQLSGADYEDSLVALTALVEAMKLSVEMGVMARTLYA